MAHIINLKKTKEYVIIMITVMQRFLKKMKKILKYNHREKSLKAPFIIYADLEYLLKKVQSCKSNPEKSYNKKKAKHEPSGYLLSLVCSFDATKNRQILQRKKLY